MDPSCQHWKAVVETLKKKIKWSVWSGESSLRESIILLFDICGYIKQWLNYKQVRQNKSFVTLLEAMCSLCIQFFNCSSFFLTTRYIAAAQTGCDLLPSGDRCPLHSCWAALGSTEVTVQQRRRVPGRRHGDQPQMARADICHWRTDAFSVYAIASSGEIYDGFMRTLEGWVLDFSLVDVHTLWCLPRTLTVFKILPLLWLLPSERRTDHARRHQGSASRFGQSDCVLQAAGRRVSCCK